MVNTQGRVGPQHRRRRRRKFSNESASDSDSAGETDTEAARNAVVMDPKCKTRTTTEDDLSFAERRQLQRNAAAEKRRLKMKVRRLSSMLLVYLFHRILCICSKEEKEKKEN